MLTRHGLTPRSTPEQHLGQRLDVPLSPEGRAQAEALGRRIDGIELGQIVSSPLRRARETAEIVAAGRPVEVDARLTEMDYGEWEGLTYAEVEARDAERRRRWEADPARHRCPGGESGDDVATRARAFLADLLAGDPADRTIFAVAHSTLNRVLLCVAIGLPVREFRRRFAQGQANLTVLRFEHGVGPSDARLLLLNDLAHLRGRGETPWA